MAVTLESLKKSVGKKNSKSKIFAWLADLELAAGDLDTALQRVNGGLTLYPNDISAKLVRSKILFQKGDFEDCVHECESILVMDPFNLAAQKIMGDAYDQLGNIAERNLCYRRYHDMDPLNSFWKEEYDVVPEAAVGAAAVAGADEFSMPSEGDESLDLNLSEDSAEASESVEGLFDHPATASGEESLDGGLFEKSSEQDVENSIDKAFGEAFGSEAEDALEQEDSPFTKSLSESQFGDSLSSESASATASPFSSSFLDDVPEEQTSTAGQIDEPIASIDDDPFAALAAMLPNSDASEDAAIDELNASLDSVMDSIKSGETEEKPAEEFPADDNVSGDDVTAALSDMFGLDDDLEAEEAPAPKAADFGSIDIDEKAEENASKVFETSAAADKPQSVDDAFDSIFGEDELPEEKPVERAPAEPFVAESPVAEAPVEEVAPAAEVADQPLSVDDAFGSIFGEDELPEEKPVERAPAEPFVAEPPVAEAPVEEVAPAAEVADQPLSVDDAFGSIFGEDELPEEKPVESAPAEPFVAESPVAEAPVEEVAPAAEVADQPLSVDDAFGSIFGEDELPEEKPVESAPGDDFNFSDDSLSLESPAEAVAAAETEASQSAEDVLDLDIPAGEWKVEPEQTFVPEVEVPSDPVIASPMDFVNDESEVGNAFSSIFGDDDDLPEEKPVAAAEEPAFEMPAVEESLSSEATLAEQVNLAESELEMPAVEPKQEPSDIAQEMGGAFASMFGDDDDLDLPDTKSEPVESSEAPQATTAAFEEAAPVEENLSSDLDKSFDSLFGSDDDLNLPSDEKPVAGNPDLASLETEVSGAFKGLFDMEDDSLTEESKPSNSGVDFLMSGDSDDEISAGLIKNPDAPLDRGVHNLEDSMGTRTLAEIYFDQGLYGDALKVYQELLQRDPSNEEFAARKSEIEKICRDKFGGNA